MSRLKVFAITYIQYGRLDVIKNTFISNNIVLNMCPNCKPYTIVKKIPKMTILIKFFGITAASQSIFDRTLMKSQCYQV